MTPAAVQRRRSAPAPDANPGDEAWALLRLLFGRQRRQFLIAASELALHPGQAGALLTLTPETPMPMNELAGQLACDNSNVTGIVDRLESRGLVARRPYEPDRRVKHVVLTSAGKRMRRQILARVGQPPAGFAELSAAEHRQLRDVLQRVIGQS